jgi:putative spermidine/putrescine transport system substrate-binding protein
MRKACAVLILVVAIATTGFATGSQEASAENFVVSYNSPAQWANWGAVLEAFTADTGVNAPTDPKNSGQTLAALQAESANPQADTAYYGIVFGIQASTLGLVEGYKPPGFEEIPTSLKHPEGEWMTIHQGAIAFLVNVDELNGAPVPQSWADLLKPEYEGKVGFLDPTQAAVGYSVSTAANLALGGSLDDWEPGIRYLADLFKNGLQLPAQTATAMVQQGEIPILIDADFNGYKLRNIDNAPIEVVIPQEGTIAVPYVMSLVKNAPRPDAGRALMDFVMSDAGQRLFAESFLRPVRNVNVDPAIARQMLPVEEYDRVIPVDFPTMREVQDEFNSLWSGRVVQ